MNTAIDPKNPLNKKALRKENRKLIQIHFGLFRKHIHNLPKLTLKDKQILEEAYHSNIRPKNIRGYYNHHISTFTQALETCRLKDIYQPGRVEPTN